MQKKNRKPNILKVSLCLVIAAVSCFSAWLFYSRSKAASVAEMPMINKICAGALLFVAAADFILLIIWGLKWVRQERVSELGMHIVRYAVILTAISLCVFILLSFDYAELYSSTVENELRQQVITGRLYIQNAVGNGLEDSADYFSSLTRESEALLIDSEANESRHVCLYLKSDSAAALDAGFSAYDGGYICCSGSEEFGCAADPAILDRAFYGSSVELVESYKTGRTSFTAAYAPVFSLSGEPVGVLELCQQKESGIDIFHFATLELCLKLLALVVFFSFLFYGCMQLVDILLRPKQFDRSRRVLSCGRESARPVLFFAALSAALPLMMLLYADNIRSLMDRYALPWGLGAYVPFIVYLFGIAVGQIFGRINRPTLSELPADAGLVFSFLCNLALCLFMDSKLFRALGLSNNVILMLVLFFVCGLGYGIAYRITAKFQAQSDALFGYDKYSYLCSCLGAVSGIALGGLLIENYSNVALRVVSCLLTAFTAVISIILLEDLKSTVDINESYKDTLSSYAGGIFAVIPVGLACCFNWIYLTGFMVRNGISVAAVSFVACAPVIAFCFGNRLRVKNRSAQRANIAISALLSAVSFLPMAGVPMPDALSALEVTPSFNMAVLSCAIICAAVIFAASGIYSMTRPGELKKLTLRVLPLTFIGIAAAALGLNAGSSHINLCSAFIACILGMAAFLLSRFPSRPVIADSRPALTDGSNVVREPVVVLPMAAKPEAREKEKRDKEKPEKEKKKKEKKKSDEKPVVQEDESDISEQIVPPVFVPIQAEPEDKQEENPAECFVFTEPEMFSSPEASENEPVFESPVQEQPAPDSEAQDESTAGAQSGGVDPEPENSNNLEQMREEAARRARERWQKYNEESGDDSLPIIFPN